MKRFIPLILDALLAALCTFLLLFTLVRYYISAAAGLAAGITGGLAAGAAAYIYISLRQKRNTAISAGHAGAEKLAAHLAILGNDGAKKLIAQCVNGTADEFVENDTEIFAVECKFEPASTDDLVPLLRVQTPKKKRFICASATPACADFAAAAGIELVCADALYEIVKQADKLPEKYLWEGKKRTKFITLVKQRFTRKLCLPSFWSGAALLFFSYFTYYPVYYIIFGSLLLVLCAAAAVFGKKKSA